MALPIGRARFDDIAQIADAHLDSGLFAKLPRERFGSGFAAFHPAAGKKIRRTIRFHVPREQNFFFSHRKRSDADPQHRLSSGTSSCGTASRFFPPRFQLIHETSPSRHRRRRLFGAAYRNVGRTRMKIVYRDHVDLSVSVERAFAFATDLARWPMW